MAYTVVVSDTKVIDLETEREVLGAIGADVVPSGAKSEEEVIRAARGADALVVDAGVRVSERVIDALESVRVIARGGIGLDNIDVRAASERDIPVVNAPAYSLDEVSTHALALALACLRKLPLYDRAVKSGEWDWQLGRPIGRLAGSTVGLVAFGKIARRVAAKLRGFDVDVIAYDPYVPDYEMADFGVEKVGFEALLARSDVVSVHAPLTDETRGLIDADALGAMREGAILVNTGRGPIVDEAALHDALVDGDLAGAGLDVRATEPPGDSPLHDLENVVLTPHVAFYSEAARRDLSRTVAEDVRRVLEGKAPENRVDPDSGWY